MADTSDAYRRYCVLVYKMKQAVENGTDETPDGKAIEKDMQRMWNRMDLNERAAAATFSESVSHASLTDGDERLGGVRGKIVCDRAEKCGHRLEDLERGFECGGALPHTIDGCEPCPACPEAGCKPIIPEEE
jgi:hypothetical protein